MLGSVLALLLLLATSSKPMATLRCACRRVQIQAFAPPVRRLECCCLDCRKALSWCSNPPRNGPPPPPFIDALYFPNALRVERGSDLLRCYLLRDGYDTRRVVARCCWTCLIGEHPAYRGVRFVAYVPPAELDLHGDRELITASDRIFESDMTADELALLPPRPVGPADAAEEAAVREAATEKAKSAMAAAVEEDAGYITVQELIGSLGKVEFMDPKYVGPSTFWSRRRPK